MYQPLFASIDSDTTLLTVNNRLARYLKENYADWQQKQGKAIFESPHILPLNAWLTELWEASPRGTLLNAHQSQALWESTIEDSQYGSGLLRIEDTAKQVAQAWQLVQHWGLDLDELAQSDCEDVQAFVSWAKDYQACCHKNNWVDHCRLAALFLSNPPSIRGKIFLVGFENIPFIINQLLDYLKVSSAIKTFEPGPQHQKVFRTEHPQTEQELEQMAGWALEKFQTTNESIACIVPDLANQRANIARIFQRTFNESDAFNISAAISLDQYPMVATALRCIQFALGHHSWQQYSALLRSPFIKGGIEEMNARAKLDARLRDVGELTLPPHYVVSFSSQCPQFQRIVKTLPKISGRQSIKQWRETFLNVLNCFGWPGDRVPNGKEYQLYHRHLQCFDEFASLRLLNDNVDAHVALKKFNAVIQNTLFQPKAKSARVQILGLLEAGGLSFDHLWIQGLNDVTLPAPLAPNPYLPVALQREKNLPRSNPEHEWAYAQTLFKDLVNTSKEVILSVATHEGDRELAPSPLLTLVETESLNVDFNSNKNMVIVNTLEKLKDDQAPAIDNEKIRGGSYLFKAQAMCPFKAFAEIRLRAESLSEPSQGLDASERGELIHEILANVWQTLGDSTQLDSLDKQWLSKEINTVLDTWIRRRPITLAPQFIQLESQRLLKIISQWLECEKERTPFKVIACEQQHTISFNGIELNLRLDRLDELPDGEKIIIDYKTGNVSISNWSGERPNDPQLLLYCVSSDDIEGISFAQIRPNKMQFKGITKTQNALPKVKAAPDWDLTVSAWRERLLQLSDEFLQGHAAVDPQFGSLTCQYCQLAPLCRIHQEEQHG